MNYKNTLKSLNSGSYYIEQKSIEQKTSRNSFSCIAVSYKRSYWRKKDEKKRTTESSVRKERKSARFKQYRNFAVFHTLTRAQWQTYLGGVKKSARSSTMADRERDESLDDDERTTTASVTALRARVASRRRASAWISHAPCLARRAPKTMASSGFSDPTRHGTPPSGKRRPRPATAIVVRPRNLFRVPRGVARCRAARHNCGLSPPSTVGECDGPPPRHRRHGSTQIHTMPHWSWPRSLVRGNVAWRQGNCLVDSARAERRREEERERGEKRMRNGDGERRGRREQGQHQPKGDGVYDVGNAIRGGDAKIVRQGSPHAGRQTLVVNRAPRTAAATRHCTPVLGVGHVLLSSPPTSRVQLHSGCSQAAHPQPARRNKRR